MATLRIFEVARRGVQLISNKLIPIPFAGRAPRKEFNGGNDIDPEQIVPMDENSFQEFHQTKRRRFVPCSVVASFIPPIGIRAA